MLSFRSLVHSRIRTNTLKICYAGLSDGKEPPESKAVASDDKGDNDVTVAAKGLKAKYTDMAAKAREIDVTVAEEYVAAKAEEKKLVAAKADEKDIAAAPKTFHERLHIDTVPKTTYDVAWPVELAGEVQTRDSPPVEKANNARQLKQGVGLWDIGNEHRPYKGHSSSDAYPIPTKPPPLGLSRLDVWRALDIKPIPQLINKPPDPTPGIGGKIIDEIADIMSGEPNYIQPHYRINENTDPRSIAMFPPAKEECTQAWYEDPMEETTMGFPVIRAPHPFSRVKETLSIRKSSYEEYPYIQDYKNHYDILIVGGGLMGSMIAYMLTDKIARRSGVSIGIVEKDPSYRFGLSVTSPCGVRMQHGLPETIESSLFGSDFFRNITEQLSIPGDTESNDDYLNVPNLKFQPQGHLTLATQDMMEDLKKDHEMQKVLGVQSAILTEKQLSHRFPWLKTTNIAGALLGLESEGYMDNWNLLRSLKLKNIHEGVDYIHGEAIYMKRHTLPDAKYCPPGTGMGRYEDGTEVPLCNPFECHILMPGTKKVYPIEYSQCIIAAGGESGNVGKMAGIGDGTGVLSVPIPVERRRQYIFQVHSPSGPGLNLPLTSDPSGLVIRRDGHCGDYLVGLLPSMEDVPVNQWGDVDQSYWDEVVLPLLQSRVEGFEHPTLKGSYAVDYDYNYYDGSPIVGKHPYMIDFYLACGFGGLGAQMAPAVARGITELMYEQAYLTIDFSRYAFDRILNGMAIKENFFKRN